MYFRQMDKMKLRPRTLKMKEVMDLILNSNDSDFGDSDSDDDDDVESTDPSTSSVNADDATSESESDPEDNEPLAKLVTSHVPVHKVAKKVYVWKNDTFTAPDVSFSGAKPQVPDEIMSPLHYFRQFISDEMLTALVENTNLYSVQKDGKSVETDVKEVERMIGIYLHMGIVKMPGVRYYWKTRHVTPQ